MSESVGKKIFIERCAPCHTIDPEAKHKVGPNLYGIYESRSASLKGFTYSDANKAKGNFWNERALNDYLADPARYIPGTRMMFAGLKKPQEREDILAYLKTMTDEKK